MTEQMAGPRSMIHPPRSSSIPRPNHQHRRVGDDFRRSQGQARRPRAASPRAFPPACGGTLPCGGLSPPAGLCPRRPRPEAAWNLAVGGDGRGGRAGWSWSIPKAALPRRAHAQHRRGRVSSDHPRSTMAPYQDSTHPRGSVWPQPEPPCATTATERAAPGQASPQIGPRPAGRNPGDQAAQLPRRRYASSPGRGPRHG